MLKVSRPTLSSLNIPSVQIGKRYKYLKTDVEAFIEQNKKPAQYLQLRSEQKVIEQNEIKAKILHLKEMFNHESEVKNE